MPYDRYDRSIKVGQSVIDQIKKMGMAAALKQARSGGASAEFSEGARRMYGNKVGGETKSEYKPKTQATPDVGQGNSGTVTSVATPPASSTSKVGPMPPSAKAAVTRRLKTPQSNKSTGVKVAEGVEKAPAAVGHALGKFWKWAQNPPESPSTPAKSMKNLSRTVAAANRVQARKAK